MTELEQNALILQKARDDMSREILFRGKRINASYEHLNGRWYEGYLCNKNHVYSSKLEGAYEIDPETVCQYTGKSDDNENKIWEEDFVKINGEWIGRVIWRDDVTAFCVFPNDDLERETYCLGFYIEEGYKVEVIGNFFDNPELLESEG